jgi:SAM-dependent methyltransferase
MIGEGHGYDPAWFADLANLEAGNYWFEARNRLLLWLADRYLPKQAAYLEIGCGTGYQLKALYKAFPEWRLSATEAQPEGLLFARERVGADVTLMQMDACHIPFESEFDVVGAYDVIEHIEDDLCAVTEVYRALKPGGHFVVSVPQHMFLWSQFDELGFHYRRYGRGEMERLLESAGFTVIDSRSFNSLLLPVMALSRFGKRSGHAADVDVLDELRVPRLLNDALGSVLQLECWASEKGVRWPAGGSRIVVAKKVESTS